MRKSLGNSLLRALWLAGVLVASACGGRTGKEPPPVAPLAESRAAQQAFRSIRRQWASMRREDRAKLEGELKAFVANYPFDGQNPLARALLSLILVEGGKVDEARGVVRPVLAGPQGTAHDAGEVAQGGLLLANHQPGLAYERLLRLTGKIIDPWLRLTFDELVVLAAAQSNRYYEAIAFMDVWLRDAQDEDRAKVEDEVAHALSTLPTDVLVVTLRAMRERGGAGYGAAIRQAIVTRLATIALEQNDARLAMEVVESGPSASTASGLEDLASSGAPMVVDGRTIGLLVSTGSGHLGVRSAQVLAGAIAALRDGAGAAADDGVRLVTRDLRDPQRAETALSALASQGAAVIVAGLTPQEALSAARFAATTHIPIILLSAPSTPCQADTAFLIGELDERDTEQKLSRALRERNVRVVVTVQDQTDGERSVGMTERSLPSEAAASQLVVSCSPDSIQAGAPQFPVQSWKLARVDGLLSLADAECTREAITEASKALPLALVAAVGFHGGEITFSAPTDATVMVATAGRFPLIPGDTQSPLEMLRKRQGAPPSWSTVLGRDAVTLARAAVRTLPRQRTEDPKGIVSLHKKTAEALADVVEELYSTEAKGFAGQHNIQRTVSVREVTSL